MDKTRKIRLRIDVDPEQYLEFYEGRKKHVYSIAENGQSVIFPANRLKPFVTREGIHGRFEISFDENNRFVDIVRLSA
ncbi:MAG: DUF2835 family protein [Chromatiales bacterium]|jgi:hypothetical protein